MDYLISFLEGIITFISPCLLPMLPVYLSYLAGRKSDVKQKNVVMNAVGFSLGFTLVFTLLGAFAGTLGGFLQEYKVWVNIVSGAIVILFGLNYLGILRIPLLNLTRRMESKPEGKGIFSSVIFGIVFAVAWTPCVGAFLGSALMLAASGGNMAKGILMLLSFSIGLGIPFIMSAILVDRLKTTFAFIKKHYRTINIISGVFLVVVGMLMATGLLGYYLSLLTF